MEGHWAQTLPLTPKLEAATLGPASCIMQGTGGLVKWGHSCLLPFSLAPPVLGLCPSALALSRLKTTFSGCGMTTSFISSNSVIQEGPALRRII